MAKKRETSGDSSCSRRHWADILSRNELSFYLYINLKYFASLLPPGTPAVILIGTGLVFFWIEQTRIARNLATAKVGLMQNKEVESANVRLEKAKADLQAEEDE